MATVARGVADRARLRRWSLLEQAMSKRLRVRVVWLLAVPLTAASCGAPENRDGKSGSQLTTRGAGDPSPDLPRKIQMSRSRAEVRVAPADGARAEDLIVHGRLENLGPGPSSIDPDVLSSSSLVLELADHDGRLVRLSPPPVPRKPQFVELPAGSSREFEYRNFVPERCRAGEYRIRLRYRLPGEAEDIVSEWVNFVLEE
jgi:hypothetical protein